MIHTNSAEVLGQMGLSVGAGAAVSSSRLGQVALARFFRARRLASVKRLWAALTGRSCQLLSLAQIQVSRRVRGSHYAGMRTVPIGQIRGSEGRCADFDRDFCPLQLHNKERWISVAQARLRGITLPPVDLIQVGDVYFVRDGHHRISVARSFGQAAIDAQVTVWEVAEAASAPRLASAARLATQAA